MNIEIGYGCYPDKFMFFPSIVLMYLDEMEEDQYNGYYLEFSWLFLYFFIGFLEEGIEE